MSERYPDYDVLTKRWTPSWNAATRRAVDERLAVAREPRFFNAAEWQTLQSLCDRILPQATERSKVPLPAYVDQKLFEHKLDGYRYASLPPQDEAWRRGLAALDAEAREAHGQPFHLLAASLQDELLSRMQQGQLAGPAWGGMPCEGFFKHRVLPDITHAYYAHPTAWNEIGFGGPASPRGYVRMKLDRRDPWEARERQPHEPRSAGSESRGG